MEESAVYNDETNQTPLHDFGPLVPGWPDCFHFGSAFKLALEAELLLLGQLLEVWWPFLLDAIAIAREVEGWERILVATEQPVDQTQHDVNGRSGYEELAWNTFAMQSLGAYKEASFDVLQKRSL